MIGWSLQPDQLRAATRLRWIYSITAAVDRFLFPEFVASDIALCNAGTRTTARWWLSTPSPW